MKSIYTLFFALAFANAAFAQQTSNTNPAAKPAVAPVQKTAPVQDPPANNAGTNLPVFKNAEEKKQWISENPEEYRRLSAPVVPLGASPELPEDFPRHQDTGDGQADAERYNAAKMAWIAKNPERYKALQSQPTGVTIISKEEFDLMPAEKQQNILAHPELYKVQE